MKILIKFVLLALLTTVATFLFYNSFIYLPTGIIGGINTMVNRVLLIILNSVVFLIAIINLFDISKYVILFLVAMSFFKILFIFRSTRFLSIVSFLIVVASPIIITLSIFLRWGVTKSIELTRACSH